MTKESERLLYEVFKVISEEQVDDPQCSSRKKAHAKGSNRVKLLRSKFGAGSQEGTSTQFQYEFIV